MKIVEEKGIVGGIQGNFTHVVHQRIGANAVCGTGDVAPATTGIEGCRARRQRHLPDLVIVRISYEQPQPVAGGHRPIGVIKLRHVRRAIGEAGGAGARYDGPHLAGDNDFPNLVVEGRAVVNVAQVVGVGRVRRRRVEVDGRQRRRERVGAPDVLIIVV